MSKTTHTYLEEDIAQIQRFFPGASPVALRTPFDLHDRPQRRRIFIDVFQVMTPERRWYGSLRRSPS